MMVGGVVSDVVVALLEPVPEICTGR
jgi:hypothetical protein